MPIYFLITASDFIISDCDYIISGTDYKIYKQRNKNQTAFIKLVYLRTFY